jgi:hypothetical protein
MKFTKLSLSLEYTELLHFLYWIKYSNQLSNRMEYVRIQTT